MKISTRTEYGMRLLIELARREGDGPVSLAGIAKHEKLPHAYLEQLVAQLRRSGLVSATRGQAGGYQLARPAAEISMADAVRALEGPLLEMPCAGASNLEACDRPQPCSVHELFQRVFETLNASLGTTNLAELAATSGGPPYPPAVRKRRVAEHAALVAAASAQGATGATAQAPSAQPTN
ncbi:MAG: Rrf2 family transcriptional regulator [Chloroflexota bacterium]|nr:Rrf2 family transcriptional regulator [Chloroflexota bacterium]